MGKNMSKVKNFAQLPFYFLTSSEGPHSKGLRRENSLKIVIFFSSRFSNFLYQTVRTRSIEMILKGGTNAYPE
jgi:hypothetical protein